MKYNVLRSYAIGEVHEVEADNADAAIQLVEDGVTDYFVNSYDNHKIIYTVEEV